MKDELNSRTVSIDGRWRNDAGSELELKQSGASLSGVYRTNLGSAELGKGYALLGWRDQRCVGFTVSWAPSTESLTSWVGLIDIDFNGQPIIFAMWLLVSGTTFKRDGDDVAIADSKPWEAFRTQSVSFRRT